MTKTTWFLFLTFSWSAASATAEGPAPAVSAGARVRLTSEGRRLTGRLASIDDTTIRLLNDDGTLSAVLERSRVSRVEVSWGKRRRVLKGMLIGASAGLASMAALGPTVCDQQLFCEPPSAAHSALVGAVAGAGWGALIGHFVKGDAWTDTSADDLRVRVGLTPDGGVRGSLSYGF